MKLIDTHCHLDLKQYDEDREAVIKNAVDSGVVRMIVPGVSIPSSEEAIALAASHDEIFAAVGIHPHEADKATPADIERVRDIAISSPKVVAIGEIGLDYYRDYAERDNQIRLFKGCFSIARELDLPVILHNRNASGDLLDIIRPQDFNVLRGVVHCFSGDAEFLREVLALDFFVSFAGNITFGKASDLRELAARVPLDKLFLETDSPYITPEPLRGKRNEPAFVNNLLDTYADIYGMPKEEIAGATTRNADKLFRLGLESGDTVAYKIRDSLYLNITHRCTNRCTFCAREVSDYVKGHNLKLDKEPSYDDLVTAIGEPTDYDEIVFCGFGEPTVRFDVLKKVASYVKSKGGKVRLTTNGEGDLINRREIATEMKGLVDRVSVSLNSAEPDAYAHLCRSVFGKAAHESILDFIRTCVGQGIKVEVTCLDMIGEDGVRKCRRLAEEFGASFRLRHLHVVG
ncbi:MAG: YchF/TatD family DNA exonuclease [Candidatus Tantalella remota]|nr:YchF/TatD family DNA exonuclease [Candidatus Tantalella remota]